MSISVRTAIPSVLLAAVLVFALRSDMSAQTVPPAGTIPGCNATWGPNGQLVPCGPQTTIGTTGQTLSVTVPATSIVHRNVWVVSTDQPAADAMNAYLGVLCGSGYLAAEGVSCSVAPGDFVETLYPLTGSAAPYHAGGDDAVIWITDTTDMQIEVSHETIEGLDPLQLERADPCESAGVVSLGGSVAAAYMVGGACT